MIFRRVTLYIALLSVLISLPAFAAVDHGSVNVRDYGAKGDGVTDDTQAIMQAMTAAAVSKSKASPIQTFFQVGPALVFPAGEYLVSDEIPIKTLEIRGEGRAAIHQTNSDKNIFTSKTVWRLNVINITFLGGKSQLDLYNPNIDTGQIIIDGCRFYGSSGAAVRTDVLSTMVKIDDCEFIKCRQSWYNNRCDQAVMRDCWIMTDKAMENQATIEHRGMRMTIENLVGVPLVGGPKQRWIDNYGTNLTLNQCRFGGEGGGFTPVYNFRKYISSGDTSFGATMLANITLDDCVVCANGSYNANCAVYCVEVPNSIDIKNSVLSGSVGVILDKKINLSNYFKNVSPQLLSYSLSNCRGELMGKLPAGLVKPVVLTTKSDKILIAAETKKAMDKAIREVSLAKPDQAAPFEWNKHRQQMSSDKYVELTDWSASGYMDATPQKNSDWLELGKSGKRTIVLFRQSQPGGWPNLTIKGKVNLDKYPWLTWKQSKGTAPAEFAIRVLDVDAGKMFLLYPETRTKLFDYHADNIRELIGVGGEREIEIRLYPIGTEMKTALETDWVHAKKGEYTIFDFMRFEAN